MRTSRTHANHYTYPKERAQERIHMHKMTEESKRRHCCNTLQIAWHRHGHMQTMVSRVGVKQREVQRERMKRTDAKRCTHQREHARGRNYMYPTPKEGKHRHCRNALQTCSTRRMQARIGRRDAERSEAC